MPTSFTECDDPVLVMAGKLMERFYRDLVEAGVTIRYLFASNPDAIGGCLKHHGYPAAAIVKVNSLKDRVEGKTDLTITLDLEWWNQHDELACAALLDHELYHVMIAHDDDGKIVLDDVGRPKIRLRPHDWQHGGFHEIAKRHGPHAEEVAAVLSVQSTWEQMHLNFGHWG